MSIKSICILIYILITIKNEVKMIRNYPIINVMFIQNDTLWVCHKLILRSKNHL